MEFIFKVITGGAGTKDWLEATKNMVIVSYVGSGARLNAPTTNLKIEQPRVFGAHLKEALEAWGLRS